MQEKFKVGLFTRPPFFRTPGIFPVNLALTKGLRPGGGKVDDYDCSEGKQLRSAVLKCSLISGVISSSAAFLHRSIDFRNESTHSLHSGQWRRWFSISRQISTFNSPSKYSDILSKSFLHPSFIGPFLPYQTSLSS